MNHPGFKASVDRLRRYRWLTAAYEIQKNLRAVVTANRRVADAVRYVPRTPEATVAYSRSAFDGLLARGGLRTSDLVGLRILELGPGEDACLALRFLAAGARNVTGIDRFRIEMEPQWNRETYRLLLADLDPEERAQLGELVTPDGELQPDGDRLRFRLGVSVERAAVALVGEQFDLICSVAVLEHVRGLDDAFASMDALLAPGGRLIHQVDLRDHGMFTTGGAHPLAFLTINERVWRLMSSHTGAPNRMRADYYRRKLAELGYGGSVWVTTLTGSDRSLSIPSERLTLADVDPELVDSVEAIRAHLAAPFRSISTEELCAGGILVVGRKP